MFLRINNIMHDSLKTSQNKFFSKKTLVMSGIGCIGLFVIFYLTVVFSIFLSQDSLIFKAKAVELPLPTAQELPGLERFILTTQDGEHLVAWFVAGQANKPLIVYLHGNGDTLKERTKRFFELTRNGNALLAIDYRGFGGSSGSPTEVGLTLDTRAALEEAGRRGFATNTIILFGESLGTTLATRFGASAPFRGVILEAPFPSITDIAKIIYWYIPVTELVKYPFDVKDSIAHLKAPLLVLHGTEDDIVAEQFSRAQFEAAPEPKQWVSIPKGHHLVLLRPEVLPLVKEWIAKLD